MAWELCSKEDVISIHPTTLSGLKEFWSEAVEQMIRDEMGTPYLGTSQVLTNETSDGDGNNLLIVRRPPIISVEAIRISGVTITSADYVVYANYVKLVAQNFVEGVLNVQIDYTSGDTSVSPRVRMAAASMIAAILNYKGRYGAGSSIKFGGDPDVQVGETTPNMNIGLTSHLKAIMKRMLRRERIRAS